MCEACGCGGAKGWRHEHLREGRPVRGHPLRFTPAERALNDAEEARREGMRERAREREAFELGEAQGIEEEEEAEEAEG